MRAYRSVVGSPLPDVRAAPRPDAADPAVEAGRDGEAAATEPVMHQRQSRPSLQSPGPSGEGRYLSAVAEPGAPPDAAEIGDEGPQLEL